MPLELDKLITENLNFWVTMFKSRRNMTTSKAIFFLIGNETINKWYYNVNIINFLIISLYFPLIFLI